MANPFADLKDEDFFVTPGSTQQATTPAPQAPAQPSASAPPEGAPEGGTDLGPLNMTVGALRDAAQGVINLATDTTNEALTFNPVSVANRIAGRNANEGAGGFRTQAMDLPQIARSDHEWVNAGRSILKYVAGAAGGMATLRGLGAGAGVVGDLLGGFIGDFAVADKADGNLSNLVEEVPALSGPITRALSVDEDDGNWEVRLKTAVEGIVVGAALSSLLKTVGLMRTAKKMPPDEATAFLDKHADELADAAEDLRNAPEQLELFPDVVRREENLKDIDLLIRGDRVIDPVSGEGRSLNLSREVREEIDGLANKQDAQGGGASHKLGDLSEAARAEVAAELRRVRALPSEGLDAAGNATKIVRPKPFELNDAARVELGDAIRKSLDAGPLADDLASTVGELAPAIKTAFNYRYMDTPESVKMVLDDFATALKPMMDKRAGGEVQTFKDVEGLADTLSVKPQVLFAALSNAARHAEALPAYVVAAKTWMNSLSRDIVSISKSIDAGVATGTAEIELMRRVSILEDVMTNLRGVQTSAARATAVGRIRTTDALTPTEITSLLDGMDRTQVKLIARKLSLAESTKDIVSVVQGSALSKTIGVANEVFINGLLSGVKTHIINTFTSAMQTVLLPSYRIVGATLTGDMETAKEGVYFLRALRGQIGDAAEFSARAFRSESSILDTAYRQIEIDKHQISAANFNLNEGDPVGFAIKSLGIAVRLPSRFLTAEDEFFKQLGYRASVVASATKEAYEKGLSDTKTLSYLVDGAPKKVSQVDTYVIDRMNRAFNPEHGFAVDDKALADARRITFTQPLKEDTWLNNKTLGERVQELAAGHPLIRHFVLPFVRVPVNLAREAVYLTLLAPLRRQFWSDIQAGGTRKADALGRLTIGSTLSTMGGLLVAEGVITGAGPTDPELERVMKQSGWQPYSVRVGDKDAPGGARYIAYNRLDPFGTVLGIMADAGRVWGKHAEGVDDELAAGITLAVANAINSRTYLRGLTDILSVLGKGADKESRLDVILRQRVGSYVPSIARDLTGDPEVKRVRTYLDALLSRTPGFSSDVEAHRDNFGNKVVTPMGFPWSAINPFAYSVDKDSVPYRELREWADGPLKARFPMPHYKYLGEIDLTQVRNSKTGQSAWDRWMELQSEPILGGRNLHDALERTIDSPAYRNLKDNAPPDPIYRDHPALDLLRKDMEAYRKAAFEVMLREQGFEELGSALRDFNANRRLVPAGRSPRDNPTLEELLKR